MQTVNHVKFGHGVVVNKEVKGDIVRLTVQFEESGMEKDFCIPDSFETNFITAEGDLIEEVEAAIAAKKARKQAEEEARRAAVSAILSAPTPVAPSKRSGRKPIGQVTARGPIQRMYEVYLESAGYPVIGRSGNYSTVPAYSNAVAQVLKNENITWAELEQNIDNIVARYDIGGPCEDFGNKSNKTVINALKRFKEFVESMKNID